jgi:ribosomal protein S18 acetylase RimI-like enzyme
MSHLRDTERPAVVPITTDVTIRVARADDLELLRYWNSATDRVVAPTLLRQEAGEAAVLLALIEPWPAGHLLVDFTARATAGAAHLWHMGVHPSVRSPGIGSRLIATAERLTIARSLSLTELEVEKDNPDALRLYQRLGYGIVGEQDEVWPEAGADGEPRDIAHPCWAMRKDLRSQAVAQSNTASSAWSFLPFPNGCGAMRSTSVSGTSSTTRGAATGRTWPPLRSGRWR